MNSFCDCNKDGYCPRYQRDMSGRFREICAGINCDLGTAAAFREQWRSEITNKELPKNCGIPGQDLECTECGVRLYGREVEEVCRYRQTDINKSGEIIRNSKSPIPLLLRTNQAPGDAVAMTAAIYSLHNAHPGKYRTLVDSQYPEVFRYNPYVTEGPTNVEGMHIVQMHYPAIHDSNKRGIHFMQAWCEFLGKALGIEIPLLTNRPHLYFSDTGGLPQENYWIVCSGGKNDFTNKLWGFQSYVRVLQTIGNRIKFIQVGDKVEEHPRLHGAYDLVGKTNLRQLFELVRRCKGVLCGVSLLMHVAAALEKPAIIIAGGREPVQWNAYPKQHYLHTVGMLPCSSPQGDVGGACWRARVTPLNDGSYLNKNLCERPIQFNYAGIPVGTLPECMTLIDPAHVADLILKCD